VPSECKIAISRDWRAAGRGASFACYFFLLSACKSNHTLAASLDGPNRRPEISNLLCLPFSLQLFFCSNFNLRLCALCAPPALKADYVGAKNNAPATVKEITLLIQSADLILKSRLASCFSAAGCMMFFPLRISGAQKRELLLKPFFPGARLLMKSAT